MCQKYYTMHPWIVLHFGAVIAECGSSSLHMELLNHLMRANEKPFPQDSDLRLNNSYKSNNLQLKSCCNLVCIRGKSLLYKSYVF